MLEAAVVVPNEKWGESVKAVTVLVKGAQASESEIIDYCNEHLTSYKKPNWVEFWDSLTKNPGGKILTNEMRERYWQGQEKMVG